MNLLDWFEVSDYMCLVMDIMADDLRNIFNLNNGPLEEQVA